MGKPSHAVLERHKITLNFLLHCKKKLRKAILSNSDKDLIQILTQCVYNMLHGNIDLTPGQKQQLTKYKKYLRKLIQRNSLKTKKQILIQHGGNLLLNI